MSFDVLIGDGWWQQYPQPGFNRMVIHRRRRLGSIRRSFWRSTR